MGFGFWVMLSKQKKLLLFMLLQLNLKHPAIILLLLFCSHSLERRTRRFLRSCTDEFCLLCERIFSLFDMKSKAKLTCRCCFWSKRSHLMSRIFFFKSFLNIYLFVSCLVFNSQKSSAHCSGFFLVFCFKHVDYGQSGGSLRCG